MATHQLSFKDEPGNYSNYRYTVACQCGFAGKFGQAIHTVSQGIAHLRYWQQPVPENLTYDDPKTWVYDSGPKNTQELEALKKQQEAKVFTNGAKIIGQGGQVIPQK